MNFNKSILSIALSVAAVMFVGCSTDGYWDKAPIDSEVKYTFDQSEQTYSVAGTETLTEIKVSLTRNTNVGASTIAVDAKFNDPALSGPAEVTFADGSNTAIYTIAVGDIQVGETAAGATGVTLEKGHHIQFTVNAANGAPVGFPTTVQKMGEASADDGNYYFAYTPGKNNCAFENDGNLYIINALVGYDEGGSSVSLGWYQTVAFIWNVNYPW